MRPLVQAPFGESRQPCIGPWFQVRDHYLSGVVRKCAFSRISEVVTCAGALDLGASVEAGAMSPSDPETEAPQSVSVLEQVLKACEAMCGP